MKQKKMRLRLLTFLTVSLIITLILATAALAKSEITVEPVKNTITLTETALFKITITNEAKERQRYSLFSLVQGWDIEPIPLEDKIIEIYPGKTRTTSIKARPMEAFTPGIYNLALNIETDLGEKYSESLRIFVSPEKPLDYLPSLKAQVNMETKINPQQFQTIKLYLENRNPLNFPELVIKLESDLPEFNKETATSLSPLEKKEVEFTITPDPFQKPGSYFLFFVLEKDKETVKVISQKIEIIPLTPEFSVEVREERSFLKITKRLSVRNTGNVENTQEVTLPVTFWENLFTESTAEAIKKDGQRYLSWELTLPPNGAADLTAVQNYRYPFYFLILAILLLSVYLYLKSPLALGKTAQSAKKDATLSEIKITLHLKNLANKPLKEIEVIDIIPGIADLEKDLDVGTLRPQEIKHSRRGTMVKWKLAEIEPKEVRLITYKIKSKLKIVGTLKLPRAKAIFGHKGKKGITYSNLFRISS